MGRGGQRRHSWVEECLPGSFAARFVAGFYKALHDASHYGQSRFRSQARGRPTHAVDSRHRPPRPRSPA